MNETKLLLPASAAWIIGAASLWKRARPRHPAKVKLRACDAMSTGTLLRDYLLCLNKAITCIACMDHWRRKFLEASKAATSRKSKAKGM